MRHQAVITQAFTRATSPCPGGVALFIGGHRFVEERVQMTKLIQSCEDSIRRVEQDLKQRPELKDVLEPELNILRRNLALARRVAGLYA